MEGCCLLIATLCEFTAKWSGNRSGLLLVSRASNKEKELDIEQEQGCAAKKKRARENELSGTSLSLLTSDHDDLQIVMPAASVSPPKSCANFLLANSDPEPNREGDCGKFNFSLAKLIH